MPQSFEPICDIIDAIAPRENYLTAAPTPMVLLIRVNVGILHDLLEDFLLFLPLASKPVILFDSVRVQLFFLV